MTRKPTIDKSQIDYIEIKSKSELINLLKKHNSDSDKKTGFWLFDEAIKKDPKSYAEVNGGSWNIKYVEVKYQGETVGLISYSCDYKNYENEDILPTLHICDVQTLAGYKGFLKYYFSYIEDIARCNKKKTLTLRTYEKGLIKVYEKYGYEISHNEDNLMTKKCKEYYTAEEAIEFLEPRIREMFQKIK
jgi:hypothetical protein